jgi:hypothetical protein|tara:strand:+ start:2147 stop:3526 length:1380 start_codon:yes stop_codon:yes gene_type:complete
MMRFLAAAAVFTFLSLMPVIAQACSCAGPGSPAAAMERARAVFTGHVRVVKNTADNTDRVMIDVDKIWKGDPGKEFILGLPRHGCAYWNFEDQKDYLIYADKSWDKDNPDGYSVTMCSRTKPLEKARIEIRYLDAAVAGRDTTELDAGLAAILLSEQPDNIRTEAAIMLGGLIRDSTDTVPEEAVKALVTASQYGGTELKTTIAGNLANHHLMGRQDVKTALTALLDDRVFSVRSAAAGALSIIARNNSTVFAAIMTALEKTRQEAGGDIQAHQAIFTSMGRSLAATAATEEEKAQVVDTLLGMLDDIPEPYNKVTLIQHMGFQQARAGKAVPKLLEILKTAENYHLKQYLLLALGDIGAAETRDNIRPYLKDENCYVVGSAVTALYKIDTAAFPQLFAQEITPVIKTRFDKCSYELTNALQTIGSEAKSLKPFLAEKYQKMPESDWKKKQLGNVLEKL